MTNIISNLFEFIDTAEKNRKYPENTAAARKSAVRLFETELNEQEKESLETLKKNLDQISQNVFNKNKSSMNIDSLLTYKNRFISLINDYEKYGVNPAMMANWNRTVRKTSVKNEKLKESKTQNISAPMISTEYFGLEMSRFELPLRPGVKAIILVPSNVTKSEVDKIRKYIDFLDSIAAESNNQEPVSPKEEEGN